jgi:hypothetical protein
VNSNRILLLSIALGGLLVAGCTTPSAVKTLASETQRASTHMRGIHESDLRTLATYDQNRVVQFNRLLSDYFALRNDVARAFNSVLDQSKKSTLAELDHAFDEEAERLLAVDFWLAFREAADRELNGIIRGQKYIAVTKEYNVQLHPKDPEATNQSVIATRQFLASAALKYELVEREYADMVGKIRQARKEFRLENETRMARVTRIPTNAAAAALKTFILTNNTAEIEERIKTLGKAYQSITKAQSKLSRYLDENNPGLDFFTGVVEAFTGVAATADNAGTDSLSTAPKDPADTQLPGLDDLFNTMTDKLGLIEAQKTEGTNSLGKALGNLTKLFGSGGLTEKVRSLTDAAAAEKNATK